ncbi:MAG: hypothetical protein K2X39_04775, partial [Silvanigrellaceae bacterium]|nr:hypothetical protein [Silvanigrellaceae bacterium]
LSNIVIRMRELTTQAASDTIGSSERSFLNKEFQELAKEMMRIRNQTEFNGIRLLNGESDKVLKVQVGVNFRRAGMHETNAENETIALQFGDLKTLNESLKTLSEMNIEGESGRELGGGDAEDIFQALDYAMTEVTSTRATIGAIQSRMNSAITSIDVGTENLSAAQSRIRDLDYAEETAKFTQSRILSAAGTSVLSQANQSPETVLQLLR